jgi:hypothetical protein
MGGGEQISKAYLTERVKSFVTKLRSEHVKSFATNLRYIISCLVVV